MNTTWVTWMIAAAVLGGILLLLLAAPVDRTTGEATDAATAVPSSASATAYWEPVSPSPGSVSAVPSYGSTPSVCPSCTTTATPPSIASAVRAPVVSPVPARTTCSLPTVATCGQPVTPCAPPPCSGLPAPSSLESTCGTICRLTRPGINRNIDVCVPACSMIQLHSTLPQPVCPTVCFEWSASKGHFLDPYAPNPIYFAPATHLPAGEAVWIVLKITDGQGVQYTDQLQLHIVNR